jgi:mRNA interferase YafQ
MRTIKQTGKLKRDLKREAKGPHRKALQGEFAAIVESLASDKALDPKYCDHSLSGDWIDHRDCHIKPDLVLIDLPKAKCRRAATRTPGLA